MFGGGIDTGRDVIDGSPVAVRVTVQGGNDPAGYGDFGALVSGDDTGRRGWSFCSGRPVFEQLHLSHLVCIGGCPSRCDAFACREELGW